MFSAAVITKKQQKCRQFIVLYSYIFLVNANQELRGQLETCLMEGTVLLLTDVEPKDFAVDQRFYHIIRSRYRFLVSQTPFKLKVSTKLISRFKIKVLD